MVARGLKAYVVASVLVACGKAPPPYLAESSPIVDAAAHASSVDAQTIPRERTLFIGNSFTYVNDLPGTYAGLATLAAPNHVAPIYNSVAYGAYTLTQHLADAQGTGANPELATLLGTNDAGPASWTHVFLQEQSQIPGLDPTNPERIASMASAVALSNYVAATGATSVLLMTWGYAKGDSTNAAIFPDYPTMQARIESGYRAMAKGIAAVGHTVAIAPAGLAFQSIYQREVSLGNDPLGASSLFVQLYGPDFIHPAVPGTYLAACVVTATIDHVDPTTFTGDVAGIDAATKLVLQTAARDVVAAEAAMPPP